MAVVAEGSNIDAPVGSIDGSSNGGRTATTYDPLLEDTALRVRLLAPRDAVRWTAAAALSAVLGAACVFIAYRIAPDVHLPMAQSVPGILSGTYSPERAGDLTFVWTSAKAMVTLDGLPRRSPWQCTIRMRGARGPGVPQPVVSIEVDGVERIRAPASNTFADLAVAVPPRPDQDGAALTIVSAPTFVPGSNDRRELGVQLDDIECHPDGGVASPALGVLVSAAVPCAVLGLMLSFVGTPLLLVAVSAAAVGTIQALVLGIDSAMYGPYLSRLPSLALPIAAAGVLTWSALRRSRRPLPEHAGFVVAYMATALYVLLLGLFHPSKPPVDALFHAHRLEWVATGRMFFTQPLPSGVSFPYAIGLYVVSLPFLPLTSDHVGLLRAVVCTAHVAAGALLFVAIVRQWSDPLAGAAAVACWVLVPQWFVVVGNANLTNAFAQSAATATMVSLAILNLQSWRGRGAAVLIVLALLSFLSHVSTFPLLSATLVAAAACWWLFGDATLRTPARVVLIATVVAAFVAVAGYYGHFTDVYRAYGRVRGSSVVESTGPADAPVAGGLVDFGESTVRGGPTPSAAVRGTTALVVSIRALGWPIAVLALIGTSMAAAGRWRDRLTLTLLAWCGTCAAVMIASIITRVEPQFYRYTVEFIGRTFYTAWPAAVILAGLGFSRAWRFNPFARAFAVVVLSWAFACGASSWWNWLH